MRVEYITLVMQFIVLFALVGAAKAWRVTHNDIKRTTELIRQYRSEINRLMGRIEVLEGVERWSKRTESLKR